MKKGQMIEGTVVRVDFPNKGIMRTEEGTVIVKNAIPGQRVRVLIHKKRKDKAEGRLLEVLERSPLETRKPVCSAFPACGGCMYQTMAYEEQLRMKADQAKRLLDEAIRSGGQVDEAGMPDYCFEGIKGSPREFAYRNKMEFSFGDEYKDGPLALGLHKKGSTYDIVNTPDCKLVHPDMTAVLSCVLDYCTEQGFSYYHKMRHSGFLRHLLLRRGNTTGELLACLVTTGEQKPDFSELTERLLALPLEGKLTGFLHIVNDSLSDTVQCDEMHLLYGKDFFFEELMGLRFRITPFSFFQPNSYAAEVLYGTVRDYIGDTKDRTVFDLYSGTGTIAQIAAAVAHKVIGVEIVEEAVCAARENAERNGITNCSFLAGDVLKVLDTISERPDFVILDPPRDGIHPKALPKIIAYGAERIVYISCKPTSLARDLEALLAGGYRVEKACCIDQFCHGVHVETVCLLSNRKPDSYVHLNLKMEDYYRIKDAQKEQDKK